ncbi:DNA methylase [archaeon]|jgi:putative methylase|nr:DNA methylase [archaeon]|tara:strand:- start:16661 stop:17338 length:678 start_codon:yes stop_codon:yes gene_type:complete
MKEKGLKMAKSESSYKGNVGSKKALAMVLSGLEGFNRPKVRVEQYETDGEIAAEVLWDAYMKGNIGKVSVDLGCGAGILGIGMLILGAKKVIFVDSDENVLKTAKNNLLKVKSKISVDGEAKFVCSDVREFNGKSDLVVENPPFGVKLKHIDKVFLGKAFETSNVVYSFHKSESKKFIDAFSRDNGFKITNVWDFEFPLKASQSFHTRKIRRINVSCFRIEKNIG